MSDAIVKLLSLPPLLFLMLLTALGSTWARERLAEVLWRMVLPQVAELHRANLPAWEIARRLRIDIRFVRRVLRVIEQTAAASAAADRLPVQSPP